MELSIAILLAPLLELCCRLLCCIKPSEFAPATADLLHKIIEEVFEPSYITMVQGDGAEVLPPMIEEFRFAHIFYTGSTQVGTAIYQMAAKKLIPVTLELGGKSPCIVESDADLKVAAKRIALTNFLTRDKCALRRIIVGS